MCDKEQIEILRKLAKEKLAISKDIRQSENITLWSATNSLKMIKPPVYINELPWHELNINHELDIVINDPFWGAIEQNLKREIYLWKHIPGNMVVTNTIECPIIFNDSGFGIDEKVDVVKTDSSSSVVSRHFNIQIRCEDDIKKIKPPIITVDEEQTEKNFKEMQEVFGGILEVKKIGVKGLWFTPWDNLIRWTGVEDAMMDLIMEPEYIDKLVSHFVDMSIIRMNEYKRLGLWASNNDNTRVGSGGYGYTTDLAPIPDNNFNVSTNQLWGCGNAQIFSDVSPQMHWDFSLKHELRWLENFGLNYYGCCEGLHNKMEILQKIPNLRKISTSPWAKIPQMVDIAKDKYVLSCKPSPAIFATEKWYKDEAKQSILKILEESNGCNIELIMKDVSTVNYQPERVWDWSALALETINEFYGLI